jgi:hypothetical protein
MLHPDGKKEVSGLEHDGLFSILIGLADKSEWIIFTKYSGRFSNPGF